MSEALVVVGHFSRVIKGDGTLLFKPHLHDASFLEQAKHLYHHLFKTEFGITYIKEVAKGFHVRIAEVEKPYEAEYLVGEEFSLPRTELLGRTHDALIGATVANTAGEELGIVVAINETPDYPLLTVRGPRGRFAVPFTPAVARLDGDRILLLHENIFLQDDPQ
ncbi:MAG TPA: hypothetical protein PLV42_10890 [bacterium]|nr:hypothetical protein [bacterium]